MLTMKKRRYKWLAPWGKVESKSAENIERELAAEVAPGHPLHGVALKVVGARDDCDDILFRRLDTGSYVVVHLTWKHQDKPPWPHCEPYDTFKGFMELRMHPDHLEMDGGIGD